MADIHLQEESFKRAEKARLRNKIEERKLKHALDRKHGLRDAHEYRIQMMSQERRLIEKELNKIRTEIRKPPAPDNFDTFEDGTPRPGEKTDQLPARVRGRAMSIHDQCDKFTAPPSPHHHHPSSFRRNSQAVGPLPHQHPQPADNRRPSLIGARRPSLNPGGGGGRRPSRVLGSDLSGSHGGRRTSTTLRSLQAHPGSRRPSHALTSHLTEDVTQPSVNELLQMAMKNAVMYAVKHVDKLNMNTEDDDDNVDDDDIHDDDDDDDDDDYSFDEDRSYDTTSQYQRLIVVTKESDSEDDDDDDDVNVDSRSTKTVATRKSEVSRKSVYSELEESEPDSRSRPRPLSRTSTSFTSVSQRSGVLKKLPQDLLTPRNTKTLELPRIGGTSSFERLQRGNTLSFPTEPTSPSFADVKSVASENCKRYQPKRKTVQIELPDVTPRRVRRGDSVLNEGMATSKSLYPAKPRRSRGKGVEEEVSRGSSSSSSLFKKSRKW